jgi:hypothetical protein
MSKGNQIKGYSFLVVLAVMIVIFVVSVVKPFRGGEQASPREPVVTETIPVPEVEVTAPEDTDGKPVWAGTM